MSIAGRGRFPVLLTGEDGVDVELVARLIHDASEWTTDGFFALDAALIPQALLAREIFGSEAGAIASLPGDFVGALQRTAGGTVLLEHIESLPKELQQSIGAGVLEGRFRRIGSKDPIPLECRLIASSTETLASLATSGRLAPELADRFRLLEIQIPPLRERREDILPIASVILESTRDEVQRESGHASAVRGFTREALDRLRQHRWPGNERELREQIRAAVRLSRSEEIGPEDLLLDASTEDIPSFRDAKRAFEREYVTRVLRLCDGNISRAARIAKKDRKDFYDVMRRNGIDPRAFRS